MDKIPWDTCVIALIFCVLKGSFKKGTVFRLKMRCLPLYNVETLVGKGLNSRLKVCLARVKKRYKCKFVPRLLSMIV